MIRKDMKKELERFKDSVYILRNGKLFRVRLESLNDYSHYECELHHYIPFASYSRNEKWYVERGIEQKLILVSKLLHQHIHDLSISEDKFEAKWRISRWKLLFNRKHTRY